MVAPLREPFVIHKPIKAMPEIFSKSLEESMLYFQSCYRQQWNCNGTLFIKEFVKVEKEICKEFLEYKNLHQYFAAIARDLLNLACSPLLQRSKRSNWIKIQNTIARL